LGIAVVAADVATPVTIAANTSRARTKAARRNLLVVMVRRRGRSRRRTPQRDTRLRVLDVVPYDDESPFVGMLTVEAV
jgi:hypothetical protein